MYKLDWAKRDKPRATHEDLDKLEAEMEVKLPVVLRRILTEYGGKMPERDGELVRVVTLPNGETGKPELIGFLSEFVKPSFVKSTTGWLGEQFNFRPEKIIKFASDGGSQMLLCYDNDPTNANPEIRNVWAGSETLEAAWKYFAPNLETLLENLKTEPEARALGILD